MKRLIRKSNSPILHLKDVVKSIDQIVICEDLERRPYIISCSSSTDEDELDDEQFYITLSNEELLSLSRDIIHGFENIELLSRIAKLDYDLLSVAQKLKLKHEFGKKVIIDESDVEAILDMIKNCKTISYEGQHWKTNRFLKDNDGNFRKEDCLSILQQLTVDDYVANSRSFNLNHLGNNLIIFEPEDDWETSDGELLADIKIYVKLDIDETDGSAAALVSMHQAEYDTDKYPYKKNKGDR